MKRIFVLLLVLGIGAISTGTANAAIARELTYSEATVWRCAVRFLRVDSGYKILEKDKDAGYLLFEIEESGQRYNGSMEILQVNRDNRKYVRIQMNIPGQPKYVESLMVNKLERKLKREYGFPPTADYVSPPVDLTGNGTKAKAGATKSNSEDADEDDLEVDEDELEESQEE